MCAGSQRILNTDYALPAHVCVSAECRDLLGRILVADPAARISLAAIQQHAWFLAELPEGCQDMNARLLEEPPEPELQARAADPASTCIWCRSAAGAVVARP